MAHGHDNLACHVKRSPGCYSAQAQRASQPNENGDFRRQNRRSKSLVPAPAGVVRVRARRIHDLGTRPRACGGGPRDLRPRGSSALSSPRLRGWSGREAHQRHRAQLVPAPAGVVRPSSSRSSRWSSRPRACGGGPMPALIGCTWIVSSPRLRGWSGQRPPGAAPGPLVPAPAGVVPRAGHPRRAGPARPRACGGGPGRPTMPSSRIPLVPAPAGVVRRAELGFGAQLVPAPAGVVPGRRCPGSRGGARPRACGGGPVPNFGAVCFRVSSPRLRGWSARR